MGKKNRAGRLERRGAKMPVNFLDHIPSSGKAIIPAENNRKGKEEKDSNEKGEEASGGLSDDEVGFRGKICCQGCFISVKRGIANFFGRM